MGDKKDDLTRLEDLQDFEHAIKEDEADDKEASEYQEQAAEAAPPIPENSDDEEENADELDFGSELEEDVLSAVEETLKVTEFVDEEEESEEGSAEESPAEADILPEVEAALSSQPEGKDPLQEVQESLADLTYGQLGLGQGPSFSVSVKNISSNEVKEKIRALLKEVGLEVSQYEQGINLGQILIGHINEYCAIYLAHKLRDIPVEISLGPSELIHHAKTYDDNVERGISPYSSVDENREQSQNLHSGVSEEFFISFSSHAPQRIAHQLGMIQAVRKVFASELADIPELSELQNPESEGYKNYLKYYQSLIEELKQKALKKGAHGLIQLNFQLIPLSGESETKPSYQVVATAVSVQF